MLQAEPVIGFGHLAQEPIDLIHAQLTECGQMFIKLQEAQKEPQATLVSQDRQRSQTTHLPQVSTKQLQLSFRCGHGWLRAFGDERSLAQKSADGMNGTSHMGFACAVVFIGRVQVFLAQLGELAGTTLQPAAEFINAVNMILQT